MGRPTKLTPEVASVILAAVEHGVPDTYAAQAAGIAPSTLRNWKRRGEQEADIELDPDDYTKDALIEIANERGIDVAKSWNKPKIADEINAHHSPYFAFLAALREAEAKFLRSGMEAILAMSLATRDWRGILALIERRFPEVMGRRPSFGDEFDESSVAGGTEDDAQRLLDRAEEIRIKMLEAS